MQKHKTFRSIVSNNLYLLIIGAWLFTITIIVDTYWSDNASAKSVQKKIGSYVQAAETDFAKLFQDSAAINKIKSNKINEAFLSTLTSKKYFLFFYAIDSTQNHLLTFWNTQQVAPTADLLFLQGNSGFVQLQNGYYVWNSITKNNLKAIALIPVKWNYIVTNEYLQNTFIPADFPNYELSIIGRDHPVRSIYGRELFQIKKVAEKVSNGNPLAVLLSIAGILAILMFANGVASFLAQKNALFGTAMFALVLLLIRMVFLSKNLPADFRDLTLFNSTISGTGSWSDSLGDLLVNAILFVWLVLFVRSHANGYPKLMPLAKGIRKWLISIAGSLLMVALTFAVAGIIRSLVADSQLSFDVINFFSLNIYSVVGFMILCCLSIGYYFFAQTMLFFLRPLFPSNILPLYVTMAATGLLVLSFRIGNIPGGIDIFALIWLILFLFFLNNNYFNLLASHIISSKLVFWLFFFSTSITALIIFENSRKELRNRRHYAEIISTKADPSSELLINSMLTDFREDYLAANFYKLQRKNANQGFKDSLVQSNFSGYTDRYSTQIFSFTASEQPLHNADATSFNQLNTILTTQAKPTGVPDLFYYDVSYDKFSYISKKVLRDDDANLLGYVFIIASPRQFKSELYPELFGRGNSNAIENSSQYAFAVYNNWKLISSHNDYPFATNIDKADFPRQEFVERQNKNYNELWYKYAPDRIVVIAKENNLSIESITLFSYLFCSFLLLTFIFWILNIFLSARFNLSKIKNYWQFSIRNQIHGTIIFISVLSFIVIGIATILFFIARYENNNREKLSRTIRIMEAEVKSSISAGWSINDSLPLEINDGANLNFTINRISEIHGADVNLYDLEGKLQVSSLALPYVKGIVSTLMDPVAFYHLNNKNEIQYFQKEKIGKLNYVSNYIPVIDDAGNKYAYLNIPYFTSQSKLRDEISNFLVTIINLNAFIFLIAGVIALFITNSITNTFSLIGDKMKKVNLGTHNEAITWTRGDEIGELVKEYNKMVSKLDASAEALAKNEREGAWREMAKQIAHEIKNPLTPMKLSMQYLQRSIEENAPNIRELSASVAKTLVTQIDHLSHIAGEFSQFANIENSKTEVVDLKEILQNVLQLFGSNSLLQIESSLLQEPVYILADKSHITRIFTNLMQNALQAEVENKQLVVHITEKIKNNDVEIRLQDNGTGIDEDIQTKIFIPNFTTKTSGTGLGLAMCKRMVEQAKGAIWFTTVPGKGTAFYVKFPLYKKED
ncbi:MAG: HAMP domain-containing sensor histidine kinase [Ferruginibacter sp.]